MPSVRRWGKAVVVAVVVLLVIGRWLALSTADRLWAEALGVGATHAEFARVRAGLWGTAFLAASLWCIGNLYLVYRSIRSVRVPRRLGDLEIVEAVPRRALLLITVAVGLALALVLAHGAGDWWPARVLAGLEDTIGTPDPVLGRDLSYYLFQLPWHRAVRAFALRLVGGMLGITALSYVALGAVRWSGRRLRVTDLARWHLAGLLATFALSLVWGYRLEPAELVAGIGGVPADAVLTEVRIPLAQTLAVVALLVSAASLAWMWTPRVIVVWPWWLLLAGLSLAGHHVLPAVIGGTRSAEERRLPEVDAARGLLTDLAFGTRHRSVVIDPAALPESDDPTAPQRSLDRAPVWDGFAVTATAERLAVAGSHLGFTDATLGAYRGRTAPLIPVYVAAQRVELPASRDTSDGLSWDDVHLGSHAAASGAVGVAAHRVSEAGGPYFITDLGNPDQAAPEFAEISLEDDRIVFAPGHADFAVFPPGQGGRPIGVRSGGLGRRVALAWSLQSPQLLVGKEILDASVVVWRRDVVERLEQFAPFARFATPRAVVVGRRLWWVASGIVTAEGFPGAPAVRWRGRTVHYLRSSLIGVVDAASGHTTVYLTREADPVSIAWSHLMPEVVRPASQIPADLVANLPYPTEALGVQAEVLRRSAFPGQSVDRPLQPVAGSEAGVGQEPYWWVGPTPVDPAPRLRLLTALEWQESGLLAGLLDGTMREARPTLELYRPEASLGLQGPLEMARRFTLQRRDLANVDGALRMVPVQGGVAALQSAYLSSDGGRTSPVLVDVAVSLAGALAGGPTLEEALSRVRAAPGSSVRAMRDWDRARQWFERLDAARRSGDWAAFGRAYEELRRLLAGAAAARE